MRASAFTLAVAGASMGIFSGAAHADAPSVRVVLLPVVVGAGAEPSGAHMDGLARGLAENATWAVLNGSDQDVRAVPTGFAAELRTRFQAQLSEAARLIELGNVAEAMESVDAVRNAFFEAAKKGLLAPEDFALVYRAGGLAIAALLKNDQPAEAKTSALEIALVFPGRKPSPEDEIPAQASALLAATVPTSDSMLKIDSRPAGCDVFVNGSLLGRAPVETPSLSGVPYQTHAVCPTPAGAEPIASRPKRFVIPDKEPVWQEILDVEFERRFRAEGGKVIRFSSQDERRQMEESHVRRVAERFDADMVVFASLGELGGGEWLNGRLHLSTGQIHREGLVRLDPTRTVALGRYLAKGKPVNGVLRPEEASSLVAAGEHTSKVFERPPWYTDVVGWSFVGAGLVGMGFGTWGNAIGDRREKKGDAIEMDPDLRQQFYRSAERARFYGGIGLFGGGLIAATGVVLLAIPQYTTQADLFSFSPLPDGGVVALRGRF